jgi:hypothetical protein
MKCNYANGSEYAGSSVYIASAKLHVAINKHRLQNGNVPAGRKDFLPAIATIVQLSRRLTNVTWLPELL